jgi:hypothetical protein
MTSNNRPATLENWLPEARKWALSKYRGRLSELDWEELEGAYHIRVAKRQHDYDPTKSMPLTFLCMLWRRTYADFVRARFRPDGTPRQRRDLLDQPRTGDDSIVTSWDAMVESVNHDGESAD